MATGEGENSTLERSWCALEGLLFFFAKVTINVDATTHRDKFCCLRSPAGSKGSMGVVQGRNALYSLRAQRHSHHTRSTGGRHPIPRMLAAIKHPRTRQQASAYAAIHCAAPRSCRSCWDSPNASTTLLLRVSELSGMNVEGIKLGEGDREM